MKHKYFTIPGWFNMHEAYDLLLHHCEDGDEILEIGPFMGRSTSYLATNIINSGKKVHLYALDTFRGSSEHSNLEIHQTKGYYDIFLKNCQEYIDKGVLTPLKCRSDDINTLARFGEKHFQGIIVDGAHEYEAVMDDILNWWPKLKDGGSMVGDDMALPSVQQAVKDTIGSQKCVDSSGTDYVVGREQWFSVSKKTEEPKCTKLVPGQNTLVK
jgi:predicted O-methyltransferase YrrM